VSDGLIQAAAHREVPELDQERRRYYKLTKLGAQVAAVEAERLRTLLGSSAIAALTKRFGTP
jgi:hypothetical protein